MRKTAKIKQTKKKRKKKKRKKSCLFLYRRKN